MAIFRKGSGKQGPVASFFGFLAHIYISTLTKQTTSIFCKEKTNAIDVTTDTK